MQKPCQVIKEKLKEVYCREVYKRTGYHHFVDIEVCQKCTPEIIRDMCSFVNMAHKNLIKIKPKKHKVPPTFNEMRLDYNRLKKAIQNKDSALSGPTIKDVIPWEKYLEHRKICIKCYGGYRCPHFCCEIKARLALTTWECKAKKFQHGAIAVTN